MLWPKFCVTNFSSYKKVIKLKVAPDKIEYILQTNLA
jgi:hypothetical protein